MLTQAQFTAAQNFIDQSARSLDQARFRHAFAAVSASEVLQELQAYQNPDGGFGRGLEPDWRSPASSALCTTIALQIMREVGVEPNHDFVRSSLQYLVNTVHPHTHHWRNIPVPSDVAATVQPHAPWWSQGTPPNRFDAFSLNPTAEILGYLYEYAAYVPSIIPPELIQAVGDRVAYVLNTHPTPLEMHDLLCCLRLYQSPGVPLGLKTLVHQRLAKDLHTTLDTDPAAWADYGLRPLQVITRPDSPLMTGLEGAIAANLDFEVKSQNPDGAWYPTWDWGEMFPDAWPVAQQDWAGKLTVDTLLTLRAFDYIATG